MKPSATGFFILGFCILLFSVGARDVSLEFKGDENFYFESARKMLETRDIITPRYMGQERFEKPIFFYWLVLLAFKGFGVNWFAARMPSILFGALLAVLVYATANLLFKDRRIASFSALFSATTPLFYRYARLALPDMTLVFFMSLALYSFLKFYKNRADRKSAMLFFAALAFAVLVKGFVGFILPILIIAIFCLLKRERLFKIGDVLAGGAVFALIVGPWFYLIYKIHGGAYIEHVWTREVLQRLGSGYTDLSLLRYFKGLGFYAGALITKFLPYSLFLPAALVSSFTTVSQRTSGRDEEKDAHLFLILWIAVVLVFFTFVAEKRTHYLLALSPAISILVGVIFEKAVSEERFYSRPIFKMPYIAFFAAVIIFTLFFVFSDLISGKGGLLSWKLAVIAAPAILTVGFRYRRTGFLPFSMIFSLAILYIAVAATQPLGLFMNKMERAAKTINSELKEGDKIGIGSHGIIPEELQVFFELPVENVKVMYGRDGTADLSSAPRLLEFLDSEERVFCVIKKKDFDKVVPAAMKNRLYILDSYYVWKRRVRFDKELKESLDGTGVRAVIKIFQNEIYIISNEK